MDIDHPGSANLLKCHSLPPVGGGSFKRASLRVLLVEDDKLIQLVHRRLLNKLGCQVMIASSGEEALSVIEDRYDVILLDIELPGVSGIIVAEKFHHHKQHQKTKIIAVTTQSEAITTNNLYRRVGIARVLGKPLRMRDLVQIIPVPT